MKNRPLRKAVLLQLINVVGDAEDVNEAVLRLLTELARHYSNAIECHDKLEKYENSKLIKILRKLKVIRI